MKKLTKRQQQVLEGLMNGASDAEIAKALRLKESTAKMHIKKLYKAKGIHDRLGLVVNEYRNQIREAVCIMKRVLRGIQYSNTPSKEYIEYDIHNYFKKWGLK